MTHMQSLLLASLLLAAPALVAAQSKTPQATQAPAAKKDSAQALFAAWDKNKDGQLSQEEFHEGWDRAQAVVRMQAALRQQFVKLDANKDGALDASEYAGMTLVKQAGKNAPPMARFDANANGKLEIGEYIKAIEVLTAKPAPAGGK